jgi:hypothetical protein
MVCVQQQESFRKELGNAQFIDNVLYKQQFNHWRFHQSNRMQEAMLQLENAANQAKADAATATTATTATTTTTDESASNLEQN